MTILNQTYNPKTIVLSCDNCKKQYIRTSKTKPKLDYRIFLAKHHYCNSECVYEHRKNMLGSFKPSPNKIPVSCFYCKKLLFRFKSNLKKIKNIFCNTKCRANAVTAAAYPMNIHMTYELKKKLSKSAKKRYDGKPENHPFYGKKHSEETKQKISLTRKRKEIAKGNKNPMFGKHHTKKAKENISKKRSELIVKGKIKTYGKNNHITGYYFSQKINQNLFYRSSWERAAMMWLDKNTNVIAFMYENTTIRYSIREGNRMHSRYYVPDFLIEFTDHHKELWELKPKQFVNNLKTKLKAKAAEEYCQKNNIEKYQILTKEDLKEIGIL